MARYAYFRRLLFHFFMLLRHDAASYFAYGHVIFALMRYLFHFDG